MSFPFLSDDIPREQPGVFHAFILIWSQMLPLIASASSFNDFSLR